MARDIGRIFQTGATAVITKGPRSGMLVAVLARTLIDDQFVVAPVKGGDTFKVSADELAPTNQRGNA